MSKKTISFEEGLKRLDEIVGHLEKGDLSLEESIRCFEEGNQLVKLCSRMLDTAEQKVILLREGSDGRAEETETDESSIA